MIEAALSRRQEGDTSCMKALPVSRRTLKPHRADRRDIWQLSDTLRVSRPEDKALQGWNLSAEPEAVMGRVCAFESVRPGLPEEHHGTKAKNPKPGPVEMWWAKPRESATYSNRFESDR